MNQLEVLRESLGQCDEIILDALLMRNRIVEDIMVYKEANNVPILQPEQEAKQKEWLELKPRQYGLVEMVVTKRRGTLQACPSCQAQREHLKVCMYR